MARGPEAQAADAELSTLVERFKHGLPERERLIYELRFETLLEHKAIAQRLRLSDSKVKTSEQRIRKQFFKFMRKNGYFRGYEQEGAGG